MDRQEGTVLMGTLLAPRLALTALSSEGTDCSSKDLEKMVKTCSWVSDSLNRKFRWYMSWMVKVEKVNRKGQQFPPSRSPYECQRGPSLVQNRD